MWHILIIPKTSVKEMHKWRTIIASCGVVFDRIKVSEGHYSKADARECANCRRIYNKHFDDAPPEDRREAYHIKEL